MEQEIQDKLKEFLQRAKKLYMTELRAIQEKKVKKHRQSLLIDGVAAFAKEGLGINKQTTKTFVNMAELLVSGSSQLQQLSIQFQQ